ncbi:VWA domain-containing protein [Aureisphaera galaxeae]|uniref:vWA domain-containing protein n=1 Tax=Aureisphaera galaxeae TaxID=1538023 RepID=UPI00234FDDBC|nr:vWA domain-containing protein [Aureisphaera galaxeae]MDC8004045.1 VWA domain-containing protein [Aureisphaera galaxeae]
MIAETILYIVISVVVALALVLFMYGYKTKYTRRLRLLFGVLRFCTLLSLFLLLINPKFRNNSYTIQKPKLTVLVDNSSSVIELGKAQEVSGFVAALQNHSDLNDKFDLGFYAFGDDLDEMDSLSFAEKKTHISKALKTSNEIFKNELAPTVLITDGNQTLGQDYEFLGDSYGNKIFPVVVGDSTAYVDLKIEQLNTNRYSFLKNEFPVEAVVVYSGESPINARFTISKSGASAYSQNLSFSKENNTQTVNLTLPATRVGLQRYYAQIQPLDEEKNKVNNGKAFAVEVIDQSTNVLIISDIIHPDLGALKKSIESNEQRKVAFAKPAEAATLLNDYQLIILFQPNRKFAPVYIEIEKLRKNTWTFTGAETDWNFLNNVQDNFRKDATGETENISGQLNPNYGAFALDDLGFEDFPPLLAEFGDLSILVPHEVILQQSINGFSTGSPLFASVDNNGVRDAIWDAQGLWKWRAQSYLGDSSFEDFDDFIGRMVQYLASNKRRSRLEVTSETFYYNNNPLLISAQYFDKNFVFDNRAQLLISVTNKETEEITRFPMLLKNNYYEVDLNSLPAGDYSFTVSVRDEGVARSGSFTLLDFNVEQQFLNADVTKLTRLATHTGGNVFFLNQGEGMVNQLMEDDSFRSIQKTEQKVVPLIDWKYLLGIMVLTLSLEWFIRKYNGLI